MQPAPFLVVWAGGRTAQELQHFRVAEVSAVLQSVAVDRDTKLEPVDVSPKGWQLAWLHGCPPESASRLQCRSSLIAGVLKVCHHGHSIIDMALLCIHHREQSFRPANLLHRCDCQSPFCKGGHVHCQCM